MPLTRLFRAVQILLFVVFCFACTAMAQTESATISGLVIDNSGAVVTNAELQLKSVERGVVTTVTTNKAGIYVFAGVHPGQYQLTVRTPGFRQVDLPTLIVNVQDHIEQNFRLEVGSASESVTVTAEAPLVNTTDASVSTVVDRQLAENIPMNGRSFQALVQLAPGVVVVPTNSQDTGQFSINGQRATSNYWTVDGVSANIGIGASSRGGNGNGMAGSAGSFSALGGTNSLVSVDALQEFRLQTSTYAPEFGRTPGGQIAIVTRSGTNQFHGTLFDYLRNDVLDANNWFNTFVTPNLPKPKERQNDFGGTISGPIFKDRTFFFFSYEGLRLRLPQTALTFVPDQNARNTAIPAMQPFLNAFPLPNGADNLATGVAQLNSSFSNQASLDASSLRLDHKLTQKINLFARYNYSPSEVIQRGGGTNALSVVTPIQLVTQTGTVGATWVITSDLLNDARFNFSRTNAKSHSLLDDFGGAVPLASLPFPSGFSDQNGMFSFFVRGTMLSGLRPGVAANNVQRQINFVDSLSVQAGPHSLKFGLDFRRLSPVQTPAQYAQNVQFASVATAKAGNDSSTVIFASAPVNLLFKNLGAFAQDSWRVVPRLTLTYGLRWDVDFVPSTLNGPSIPAVTGLNLNDLSTLAIAPAGTPPFKTPYGNVAPRIGAAYQIRENPEWQTVFRGGFGVFYDLASAQTGALASVVPPFGANRILGPKAFPLSPANSAAPVIPSAATLFQILAIDPNLKLPYTLQWNFALEQSLGRQQSFSIAYVGAAGRRLLELLVFSRPPSNPAVSQFSFVNNSGISDYDALQLQFQRRLSHGLQAQASYTWAHSIDTGSATSGQVSSNEGGQNAANRGPSDFDIRHAFSLALTYDVPAPFKNWLVKSVLHGWSVESIVEARSAPPVDITDANFNGEANGLFADIRPDLVPGQRLYLFGSQFPGGKAINPAAFQDPPTTPGGFPTRQGNLERNGLRGFGATEWDLAAHRDFPIRESIRLQFRAEMFNVLNHPNFGQPDGTLIPTAPSATFGRSTQTLNQSLAGSNTTGAGSFNPLYQIGGPRSIQFGLKLSF